MTRRVALGLLAVLLVLSPLAGLAAADAGNSVAAQAQNETANATKTEAQSGESWSPPGPFSLEELRTSGTSPAQGSKAEDLYEDSYRYLGSPDDPIGSILLMRTPADAFQSGIKGVNTGQTINTDRIELVTSTFNEEALGQYTFVAVFWEEETKRVNGTTQSYAADQAVQRVQFDVDSKGDQFISIKLNSHYDETKQVTAWIERDGERVPGAIWQFQHQTSPASQQLAFSTFTGAIYFAIKNAVLSGTGWALLGFGVAFIALKRAGSGTPIGLGGWLILGGMATGAIVTAGYYQLMVLLTEFQFLLGSPLFFVALGGGMYLGNEKETWQFERTEMLDAKSLRSPEAIERARENAASDEIVIDADEYKEGLYEDLPELTVVRDSEGTRKVAAKSVREWLALLFTDAAEVTQTFVTEVKVRSGRIDKKVYLDSEETSSENPVPYTRAGFTRRMPIWHRLPDDAERGDRMFYGAMALAFIVGLPYLGWTVGGSLNIPAVGATVALVPILVESYGATPASVEINEASIHDRRAKQTVQMLQREHSDGKYVSEVERENDELRMSNAREVQERSSRRDSRLTVSMLADELGVSPDVLAEGMDDEDPLDPPEETKNGHDEDAEVAVDE